jgi:hypothetical protein
MSTKRRIIKDICKTDGLNKHQTKIVLKDGTLVVGESYSDPRKDHFEAIPADGGFMRPKNFNKRFKNGHVV